MKSRVSLSRALHCDQNTRYFCKIWVKLCIDRQTTSLHIGKIFVPSPIIFFNLTSALDYPVFKSHTFNACKWPKKQNLLTKFFAKNKLVVTKNTKPYKIFAKIKSVESTVHETGLPDAASREVSMENTDEGSKAKSVNFKMSGSQSFRGSCMIPFTTLCIVIFPERQARIFTLY